MAETSSSALAGKRIVITRAMTQSEDLARELSERGAIPLVFPLVFFAEPEDCGPMDEAISGIEQFDWIILTSTRAVQALFRHAAESGRSLVRDGSRLQVACVGPVTAEAAKTAKLPVAYVATTHNGVAMAEELGSRLAGAKVLLPRSDRANPDLPVALKRHGAAVTEVVAYRTLRPADVDRRKFEEIAYGEIDAVLFFSPSAVQYSAGMFGMRSLTTLQDEVAMTAVGPVTAKALRAAGVSRSVVAADTTAAAVVEALEKHFAEAGNQGRAGVKKA